MKRILGLIVLCIFAQQAMAEDIDVRVKGYLQVNGQQSLPNESQSNNEALKPNEYVTAYLNAECRLFKCVNHKLKLRGQNNIWAVEFNKNEYNTLSVMGRDGFDMRGRVSVQSKNGQYVVEASAFGREIGRQIDRRRVPGLCREERFCRVYERDQNGNQICRQEVVERRCEPDRVICTERTQRMVESRIDILDARTRALIVMIQGQPNTETSSRELSPRECRPF
jgi:hypothetical protein